MRHVFIGKARPGVEPGCTDLQSGRAWRVEGARKSAQETRPSQSPRAARGFGQKIPHAIAGAFLAAALTACGGGGDAPLSTAQAQQAAKVEVAQFHFILRPDSAGRWFVQNDVDHAALGVLPAIEQGPDYLKVSFDRGYTHAGVIQVTSDDDFGAAHVSGHSNLGLSSAVIRVMVEGKRIDPGKILDYVPVGTGNFWVSVTMVNKP